MKFKMKQLNIMRNMVKTIAALLIVISAPLSTYASVDSASLASYCKVLPIKEENTFKVIYQSQEVENVNVTIVDSKKDVIYSEIIRKSNGFVKDFDLSNLPQGNYTLYIESDNYQYSEHVKVDYLEAEDVQMILTEVENDYALVGINNSNSDITILIVDDFGNKLYRERIEAGDQVKKIYDMEKLQGSSATFIIYGENGVIKEKLVKI